MSITVSVNVGEFALGTVARLGDPVAIFGGEANVQGDASGSPATLQWTITSGLERRYVYVIDTISVVTDVAGDLGKILLRHHGHHEQANITLDNDRILAVPTVTFGGNEAYDNIPQISEWLRQWPIWWRRDFGGTVVERALLTVAVQNNNNLQFVQHRIRGRVFDAAILGSRDIWELFPGGARLG